MEASIFPVSTEIYGNFFPILEKNIISVNGLRGSSRRPNGNLLGHDRELNHRHRELSGSAAPPRHHARKLPTIIDSVRRNPDEIMAASHSVSKP
jgi:hypothetical protein